MMAYRGPWRRWYRRMRGHLRPYTVRQVTRGWYHFDQWRHWHRLNVRSGGKRRCWDSRIDRVRTRS
ncbi:MAG: hypothetical protein ACTHMU_26500 [Thermomicrobiales bacterium]